MMVDEETPRLCSRQAVNTLNPAASTAGVVQVAEGGTVCPGVQAGNGGVTSQREQQCPRRCLTCAIPLTVGRRGPYVTAEAVERQKDSALPLPTLSFPPSVDLKFSIRGGSPVNSEQSQSFLVS
jgi:hypothetical protein